MSELTDVFTDNVLQALKNNKHEITPELLQTLRSYGNEGKHLALELLDICCDNEQYYLDAYNNRISFNGNRRLKKSFTKLALSDIHKTEIKKCSEDIHYFKDNYVKIRTPHGYDFPDLRDYQNKFIECVSDDDNESVVSVMPRQSGKSVSTGIYLSHVYSFSKELNIGIVANKGPMAREFLANVKNILIDLPVWMQQGTDVWNKGSIENESKMRILTDVPSSDAFRGYSINLLIVDETAFINTNRWDEFSDSIFPSQSGLAWKKNILLSTTNGMNHFYKIVQGAKDESNGYKLFEVKWQDVPRYKSDGTKMSNTEFQKSVTDKHGVLYFNQNFGCQFLGSSHTLISADKLQSMGSSELLEKRDGKLNIYKYPEKKHKYIMSVDASKDGKDAFAVQVIDITDFVFEQSAACTLQIDYLLMPEFINEWCEYYNNPYLIIENNEGAGQSCADVMYQTYEYENLHFDKDVGRNKRKKYPGFRTTSKTRKQILQTMKLFIENDKLLINDNKTISEFMQFILINNKFQADSGAHDDMIMSLGIAFAPFCSTKNFENMKTLVSNLYSEETVEKTDFSELLTIGSFDSGTDEEYEDINEQKEYTSIEDYLEDSQGFI